MRKREMEKILKESGFSYLRGGKHEFWHDGLSRITIPHGNKIEQRLSILIRLQIEKAVKARSAQVQQQAA